MADVNKNEIQSPESAEESVGQRPQGRATERESDRSDEGARSELTLGLRRENSEEETVRRRERARLMREKNRRTRIR